MKYRKNTEWSDTVVNTMRSGLISRLNELGLVKREKYGKNARYHMTDAGKKYIQNLSGKRRLNMSQKNIEDKMRWWLKKVSKERGTLTPIL